MEIGTDMAKTITLVNLLIDCNQKCMFNKSTILQKISSIKVEEPLVICKDYNSEQCRVVLKTNKSDTTIFTNPPALWRVLKIFVPKLKLEISPLCFNFKNFKT